MNATEELRRLLDERGVKWVDGDASHTTEWTNAIGQKCSAMYWKPTLSVLISGCTPEQAIAATLGERHPYEQRITGDGSNWGEIMTDAFDSLMSSASESCTPDEMRALESHIAATLGGGECENLIDAWSVHDASQPDFECSECHATGHADGNVTGGEYLFCPRCGAVVRKAVER